MNLKTDYVLVSFSSSHHAIAGERAAYGVCEDKMVRLIPTPPEVSAGCGLVLQLSLSVLDVVLDAFNRNTILYEDVFLVHQDEKNKSYMKQKKTQ